jgi:hypothetical protein
MALHCRIGAPLSVASLLSNFLIEEVQMKLSNKNDTFNGTPGKDTVYGLKGDDKLYGKDNHDRLNGGAGNDRLEGGAGNDVLIGGAGKDYLKGGPGNDTFVFYSPGESHGWKNADTIADFESGKDKIDLRSIDAANLNGGNQDFGSGGIKYEKKEDGSIQLTGVVTQGHDVNIKVLGAPDISFENDIVG